MTTPCVALPQCFFLRKIHLRPHNWRLSCCTGVALMNSGATGTTSQRIHGSGCFHSGCIISSRGREDDDEFRSLASTVASNQLLISMLLLAFLAPFFDTVPDVKHMPKDTLVALFLSGLGAAASLNLSQFLMIGRMIALTFNVS
jgi:solute carrier family 35 protein E3